MELGEWLVITQHVLGAQELELPLDLGRDPQDKGTEGAKAVGVPLGYFIGFGVIYSYKHSSYINQVNYKRAVLYFIFSKP